MAEQLTVYNELLGKHVYWTEDGKQQGGDIMAAFLVDTLSNGRQVAFLVAVNGGSFTHVRAGDTRLAIPFRPA